MSTVTKKSRQRDAIIECLKVRYDHPTAEELYQSVTKIIPNVSLGTIYRNLSLLEANGTINRISTGLGADHFDYITTPHCHFTCKSCGRVSDIECSGLDEQITSCTASDFDGKITDYKLMFYGICKNCMK